MAAPRTSQLCPSMDLTWCTLGHPSQNCASFGNPLSSSQSTGVLRGLRVPKDPGRGYREAGLKEPLTALGKPLSPSGPQLLLSKGARKSPARRESKCCLREQQSRAQDWVSRSWPLALCGQKNADTSRGWQQHSPQRLPATLSPSSKLQLNAWTHLALCKCCVYEET